MDKRTLVGGVYRCNDCGHAESITDVKQAWALKARLLTPESFVARCPARSAKHSVEINTGEKLPSVFQRLGFWQTLKHVVKQTWKDAHRA